MKYVRVAFDGETCWGTWEEDGVHILSRAPYEELAYDGRVVSADRCRLLMPAEPTKIICVGRNYFDHVAEMGSTVSEEPVLFMKGPNAFNCHEGSVHAPDFVTRLDYEGELAFVVRKRARDVRPEEFSDYILGYTCFNDVTARDIQRKDGQWTRGKGMDGFGPAGPWVADGLDGGNLEIQTRLNGEVVQRSNTKMLMHKLPQLLAFITASITLEPGDVVATGTPAGVGPMKSGDVVEVEIEGIGTLRNHIV